MWRAIIATILALSALGAWTWLAFFAGCWSQEKAARMDGKAGLGGAEHLREAKALMLDLVQPDVFDSDSTFLSSEHQAAIKGWLEKYEKIQRGSK